MDKPIRVLHVVGSMNFGGVQVFIMDLYRNVNRAEVQFDFVVHFESEGHFDREIKQLGGVIYRCPAYRLKNHVQYVVWWKKFLETHNELKILHSHIRSTASLFLPIARRKEMKTIIHSHSTTNGTGLTAKLKDIMQLPLRKQADYFFACSDQAGRWLFGEKICKSNRYHIVRNGINLDKFCFKTEVRNFTRKKYDLETKFVVGNVGRFIPLKNHLFLLDVFQEVLKLNQDAVLLLIGEGQAKRDIERKAVRLFAPNKVIFIDKSNHISDLMQAMDVFLFPSIKEGLGIVLIEAQATGLPCFVSKGAIPKEAVITSLVKEISLSNAADDWARCMTVTDVSHKNRDGCAEAIRTYGYDIRQVASWVELFYRRILD